MYTTFVILINCLQARTCAVAYTALKIPNKIATDDQVINWVATSVDRQSFDAKGAFLKALALLLNRSMTSLIPRHPQDKSYPVLDNSVSAIPSCNLEQKGDAPAVASLTEHS